VIHRLRSPLADAVGHQTQFIRLLTGHSEVPK